MTLPSDIRNHRVFNCFLYKLSRPEGRVLPPREESHLSAPQTTLQIALKRQCVFPKNTCIPTSSTAYTRTTENIGRPLFSKIRCFLDVIEKFLALHVHNKSCDPPQKKTSSQIMPKPGESRPFFSAKGAGEIFRQLGDLL